MNTLIRGLAVAAYISMGLGCSSVNPGLPIVEFYGAPLYQIGGGFPNESTREDAALARGRLILNELRYNRMNGEIP
jgi:hypothetical protein